MSLSHTFEGSAAHGLIHISITSRIVSRMKEFERQLDFNAHVKHIVMFLLLTRSVLTVEL